MRLSTTSNSQSTFNNLETQSSLDKQTTSRIGKAVLDREASPIPVFSQTPKFILSLKSTSLEKNCLRSSSSSRLFASKPNFWRIPLKSLEPEDKQLPKEAKSRGDDAERPKHLVLRKVGSLGSSLGASPVAQSGRKKSQSQLNVEVPADSLRSGEDLDVSQDVKSLLNKEIRDPIEVKIRALSRYNHKGSQSPAKPILHLQSPKYCPRSKFDSTQTYESSNLSSQPRKSVEKKVHFSKNLLVIFFEKDKNFSSNHNREPLKFPASTAAAAGGKRTVYFRRPTRKPVHEAECLGPRSGLIE